MIISTTQTGQRKMYTIRPRNQNPLQIATFAARARLNNQGIATAVKSGKIRIIDVVYVGRKSEVTPLTDWMPLNQIINALKSL
jgi:hypothetical protein